MGNLLEKLYLFISNSKLEKCMVGLENLGKTTMLNQLSMGEPSFTVPTVRLNVRTLKKGGVTMNDKFNIDQRGAIMLKGVMQQYFFLILQIQTQQLEIKQASLGTSKKELHNLLDNKSLHNIPLLVIGNKIDVNPHLYEKYMIEGLNLDYITSNVWAVAMGSASSGNYITQVVDWLIEKSKKL
ncbi:unnamed protein product [Paramecium octaurelia]|uniref:Uncharacterized protein n=1 Tax=Paramecium octaurelia TaxID=43137 RepID=A0A8S1VZD0_PAROT|nr:unnamed protein product [Paramecium octaurelia]